MRSLCGAVVHARRRAVAVTTLLLLLSLWASSASAQMVPSGTESAHDPKVQKPKVDHIDLSIPVPIAIAFAKVTSAFIDHDLLPTKTDQLNGLIESGPTRHKYGLGARFVTYRANLLALGDTATRVILSGGHSFAGYQGITESMEPQEPLTNRTCCKAWDLLKLVADQIHAGVPHGTESMSPSDSTR